MASVLPDWIHCTVKGDAGPVAGIFVTARSETDYKNDHQLVFGPTSATGELHITREDVIAKAAEAERLSIMDYGRIERCFSGNVRLRLMSRQGVYRALTACEDFRLGRRKRRILLEAARVIESRDPRKLVLEATVSPPEVGLSVSASAQADQGAESLLDPQGSALLGLMGHRNVKALREGVPAWRIKAGGLWGLVFGGGARFERRRRAVLASVFDQFPRLYFMGDPTEFTDGADTWPKASKGVWMVPSEMNVHLFHSRAYAGNWRLFVSDMPLFPEELSALLYRANDPDAILDWMDRGTIRFLLDSWHDNVEWVVAVGRPRRD